MKKIAILYTRYTPTIDAIKYQLADYEVDTLTSINDYDKYELVVLCGYEGLYEGNAINCHHSLLPALDSNNPEKDAIIEGLKVTGITIYYTNPRKIIAQYPVFIKNSMHYEDLKQELDYLEQTIYPLVLSKILKNEQFEIQSLIAGKCDNNCGGCCGCNH